MKWLGACGDALALTAGANPRRQPGLATLLGSYRAWWSEAMLRGNTEAATVDPATTSVEIFDALAIYSPPTPSRGDAPSSPRRALQD